MEGLREEGVMDAVRREVRTDDHEGKRRAVETGGPPCPVHQQAVDMRQCGTSPAPPDVAWYPPPRSSQPAPDLLLSVHLPSGHSLLLPAEVLKRHRLLVGCVQEPLFKSQAEATRTTGPPMRWQQGSRQAGFVFSTEFWLI